jgi:hypothetical protein
VIGGDGEYVSAREICQWTGEVKLFRVQRAVPQLT